MTAIGPGPSAALEVYDGTATIVASFAPATLSATKRLEATVTVQACSDTVCLLPSKMTVTVLE